MHELLKALREGYTITIRPDFNCVAIEVHDAIGRHAKRIILAREIDESNFDVILYSVDECIRVIKDMQIVLVEG